MNVLIAEDDPVTLESLQACLEGEGFCVITAGNGREALTQWQETKPDVLCLDIMMPEIDGYEVCKRIREHDAAVPILFLSAKNEEIDVVVGLELGADDFIRKPFGKRELLARVRAVLRRGQTNVRERKSFAFGPWTVYPNELRAESDDVSELELTPREAAMLTLLEERTGEVVDRNTMLDRCWGMNYFPESRTLDQHIAKLRKKIEADATQPKLIETVRGVGYRYRRER